MPETAPPGPTRAPVWFALGLCVGIAGGVGWSAYRSFFGQFATHREITTVIERQQAAWNAGDLDGFMAEYRMSDETVMYSGGNVRTGWTTILDKYRKTYQAPGATMGTLAFEDIDVIPISADAAVARGKWKVAMPSGKKPSGLFTLLMKRGDRGWKIVHDHTSSADEK